MTPSSSTAHGERPSDPDHEPTRVLGPSARVAIDPTETPPPREQSLPQFDGYEVLGELGRGGMAVVYKARQLALNRVVALKVILGGAFAHTENVSRFRREAEAVARLQHPNIVQIFEVGVRRGRPGEGFNCPYIALEFVEGGTLARRLGHLPQPPRESARLVETLARAVHSAHEQGIIHRDLKPGNVLLTADGTPKLGDFGLAKTFDTGGADVTVTGVTLGTPEYMSPEQARAGTVGPASDVYALGVILYEMLTGRRPFEGENALSVMDEVVRQLPRPPRRLRPDVPRDLELICLKCLAKEPTDRYASAAALADDLARFAADEPIRARPQGPAERLARWCRRKPLLAGMTAALVAVFLLGFAAVTALWLVADSRGRLAEDRGVLAETKSREVREALAGEARARAEGQLHIARLDFVTAARLLEEGDLLAALPWLVEAMQLEEQGFAQRADEWPAREHVHRVRLAAVLRQCPRPVQVWTNDRPVRAAFFDTDGRRVFTATPTGPVRCLDTDTGAVVFERPALLNEPTKFALAGGVLATGHNRDILIALSEAATGRPIGELISCPGPVRHLALSPDGRRVLAGSSMYVAVWEVVPPWGWLSSVVPRKPLWSVALPQHSPATAIGFTADGKRVVVASQNTEAELWDSATGELLTVLKGAKGTTAVARSPDGKLLATCDADGARLWDAGTGEARPVLAHGTGIVQGEFSPDSRFLVTAGGDGTARVWNVGDGTPRAAFRHAGRLVRVAFSPDGRRLLTASQDGTARVWDSATGQPLLPPLRHARPLTAAAFHPAGDRVLTAADDGVVRIWDVTAASHPAIPLRHAGPVRYAAFDPAGGRVATAGHDGSVRVWDSAGAAETPWMIQDERLVQVNFHPAGRALVTAGHLPQGRNGIGVVQSWDLDRAAPGPFRLVIGAGPVTNAAFSPDGGRVLLTGPFAANVWDMALRRDVVGINHGHHLRHAVFSPDGMRVAVGTNVGFGVWESATRTQYRSANQADIFHVALSPDGTCLAVAGGTHVAGVFETATGAPITPALVHDGPVRHVAFSPDGKSVVTASDDRTARLWDAATGRPLVPALQHRGPVALAVFSPSGRAVLTACSVSTDRGTEGRVRWWDTASGEPIGPPLAHTGPIHHAAVSSRGGLVVAACEDGAAWLWPTPEPDARPADDLRKLAEVLSGQRLDPRLGPVPLTHETLEASWSALQTTYPDEFHPSAVRVTAWQRFEASQAESSANWTAAAWHLDRLLAAHPGGWELTARRAHTDFSAGKPEQALGRFAAAAKLAPPGAATAFFREQADRLTAGKQWPGALWYLDRLLADRPTDAVLLARRAGVRRQLGDAAGRVSDLAAAVQAGAAGVVVAELAEVRAEEGRWAEASALLTLAAQRGEPRPHTQALAALKANDDAAYRRVCETVVPLAVANRWNPRLSNEAAWVCALKAGAVADYAPVVKLAEDAVASTEGSARQGCLNTLGAVLHRAGRHRDAAARLRESISLTGGEGGPEDWIFLGLVHHALGEPADAKRCLEKAQAFPRPNGGFAWSRVEADLLLAELETALAPKK